jgi:hypothetical protein
MREDFLVTIKHNYNYTYLYKIVICLILSFIIVCPILGFKTVQSIFSFIILSLIIYLIISTINNDNLANELPSTIYPSLPHTGLDGISLNSYVTGMDTNKLTSYPLY